MDPIKTDTQKIFVDYLKKLRGTAQEKHPTKRIQEREIYYEGDFSELKDKTNLKNERNVIKPIINTKTTILLDNNLVTTIVPAITDMANLEQIKSMHDVSDILRDCNRSILNLNKKETLFNKIVSNAYKHRVSIVKTTFDSDFGNLGNVRIEQIPNINFFPDPNATTIETCNYIFIRYHRSAITLKRQFPNQAQAIEKLQTKADPQNKTESGENTNGAVITTRNDSGAAQLFAGGTNENDFSGVQTDNIEIWECYLKDSTVINENDMGNADQETAQNIKYKYPFGRFITFTESGLILCDKPIQSKNGYGISLFAIEEKDRIFSDGGIIKDLMEIQDRINRAYDRRAYLVSRYLSLIINDSMNGLNKDDFLNADVLSLEPGSMQNGAIPQILTNNTLSELKSVNEMIMQLKEEASEIAQTNRAMQSGQLETGIKSGEMVKALNATPVSIILGTRKLWEEFLIDLSQKIIILVQENYTVSRIIKLTSGNNQYAQIGIRGTDQNQITINEIDEQGRIKLVKTIQSDFEVGTYTAEIITGSEVPRSPAQMAELTEKAAERGYLGDPGSIEVKEMVLTALDFPNRRAIIERMRKEQSQPPKNLTPDDLIFSLMDGKLKLKDLERFPDIQKEILKKFGFTNTDYVPESLEKAAFENKTMIGA